MYCYDLNNLFDVESICSMIRLLPKSVGIREDFSFNYNNKRYNVHKEDDRLTLTCSDGRCLTIGVSKGKYKNEFGVKRHTDVACFYHISNNSSLRLFKILEDSSFDDLEELESYRLSKNDLSYVVIANNTAFSYKDFKEDAIDDFIGKGNVVKYKNYYLYLESDFITIDDKLAPTKEEVLNFNMETTKRKIVNSLYDIKELEPYVVEYLLEKIDDKEMIKLNEELRKLYDRLPSVKEANKFRELLFSGNIKNYIFTNEEMAMFNDVLINEISKRLPKTDEDILQDNVEEIIRTVYEGAKDFVDDAKDVVVDVADEAKKFIKKTFGL